MGVAGTALQLRSTPTTMSLLRQPSTCMSGLNWLMLAKTTNGDLRYYTAPAWRSSGIRLFSFFFLTLGIVAVRGELDSQAGDAYRGLGYITVLEEVEMSSPGRPKRSHDTPSFRSGVVCGFFRL